MNMLEAIRAQIEEISKQISKLQNEAAELKVAERVVSRLMPISSDEPTGIGRGGQLPKQTDFIIQTLRALRSSWVPDWSSLQRAVRELHGIEIPKSSLQPYLSNLKNDGVIVRDGPKIALRERVERGAGPHSDNSYDPATAAAEEDEDDGPRAGLRPPPSLERLRAQAEAQRRASATKPQGNS